MNVNKDYLDELETEITLLETHKENAEFVEHVKTIVEFINNLDIATTESKILKTVLPSIQNRFNRVFSDNYSFSQASDDDLLIGLIRDNLEIVFQLTEIVQKILHYLYEHCPVELTNIESVLKYLPKYVQLFTDHWKNSSDAYKDTFTEEITKIIAVIKHLHASFLYLLEFSISVQEDEYEISLLANTLTVLCEMPMFLGTIEASTIISSWKCFGVVTNKYSSFLEKALDVRIPIKLLTKDVCQIMESSFDHDMEAFRRQLKIISFLTKILCKILNIFYQQLNNFALELLMFYVRVLSYSSEYYARQNFSAEGIHAVEREVFKNLDELLQHLIVGQSLIIKDHIRDLSDKLKSVDEYEECSLGFLRLLNKILNIISDASFNWSDIVINLIEDVFEILPHCYKELFLDGYDGGIYQHLIINMSAAILYHDANFCSTDVLLKYILQDNVLVAVLALEIYTLVVSNIPQEECLLLLINLLYGVDELTCGFFTHRPEMIYLKCLLQRLFAILPDSLKEQVIKLFRPDQSIQIWRFLGFNSLPSHRVQIILEPVVDNTSVYISSVNRSLTEDEIFNIAEGLDLISTMNDLNTAYLKNFHEVVSFIETFWSSNITNEILNNNIMKYFVAKINVLTANCIRNSEISPHLVFPKLKLLLYHKSYRISIFKILFSILNSLCIDKIPLNIKQDIFSQIGDLIPLSMKNSTLLQETYLEMLKNVNRSHNDILNTLLDNLNPKVANHIFGYIDQYRKTDGKSTNIQYFNSLFHFTHVCLKWNEDVDNTDVNPSIKRFKFEKQDQRENKLQNIPVYTVKSEKQIETKKMYQQKRLPSINVTSIDEDDSSATEVIERIKGEVKCLLKVCKTEKLTQKNVATLRILMSQLSSLMS